jgi:hypothetical protein
LRRACGPAVAVTPILPERVAKVARCGGGPTLPRRGADGWLLPEEEDSNVTDFDRLTWDEAMRRGHEALIASEGLYDEINALEGRSNIDIEKHLRRSEVKATQAQVWLALARELGGRGDRYGHEGT